MGWYFAVWMYFFGSVTMWWWSRSRDVPMLAKVFASLLWPAIVPIVMVAG